MSFSPSQWKKILVDEERDSLRTNLEICPDRKVSFCFYLLKQKNTHLLVEGREVTLSLADDDYDDEEEESSVEASKCAIGCYARGLGCMGLIKGYMAARWREKGAGEAFGLIENKWQERGKHHFKVVVDLMSRGGKTLKKLFEEEVHVWQFLVSGVKFEGRQDILASLYAEILLGINSFNSVYLALQRDPMNAYDHNAIKILVWHQSAWHQVGYVPKKDAADIAERHISQGRRFKVSLVNFFLHERKYEKGVKTHEMKVEIIGKNAAKSNERFYQLEHI